MSTMLSGKLPFNRFLNPISRFLPVFIEHKEDLSLVATRLTKTSRRYHAADHQHTVEVMSYLLNSEINAAPNILFKPKGTVLIGLSANEPLIVSVVPIVAALLAGNSVLVRPSSRTADFTARIVGLLHQSGIPGEALTLVEPIADDTPQYVRAVDFVLWLGSYTICKKVALTCIAEDRKFYLEAEGNDYAVIDETVSITDRTRAMSWIMQSVLRHDGQICQAVRGVLVHESIMDDVLHEFRRMISEVAILPAEDLRSVATEAPRLLVEPDQETMAQSYFGPRLWLKGYRDEEELTALLNQNPFGLSLSVFSAKPFDDIKASILDKTRYARLVINSDPAFVDPTQPWGGLLRSGMNGVEDWLFKFVDRVFIQSDQRPL